MVILNPITYKNEFISYPMNNESMFYYQTLVVYYYKKLLFQTIHEKEEINHDLLKKEKEKMTQQTRDLKRHNQMLREELLKMDANFQIPKLPKMIKPGTVIFPKGMEVDEDFEIQFGFQND
jgi:hypothetical protein